MRKRSLGLLLALVLALSPVFGAVSFADDPDECTHEYTYSYYSISGEVKYEPVDAHTHKIIKIPGETESIIKVVKCGNCGLTLEETEVEEGVEEHYSWTEGVCDNCGYECEHSNLSEPVNKWDDEDVTIEAIDNKNHHISGKGRTEAWCEDCGKQFIIEENVEIDEEEQHHYEDGVCSICNHKNTCEHPNMEDPQNYWDDEDVKFEEIDNKYHRVTGIGGKEAYCPDCGIWEIVEENVEIDEQVPHAYEDGVCRLCKHKNTCTHPNKRGPETWIKSNKTYESLSDLEHQVSGIGDRWNYCPDCLSNLDYEEDVEIVETEHHTYEDNVCVECGHENQCAHQNLGKPYIQWDYDTITITPKNNIYHTITGKGVKVSYCPDCGAEVIVEKDVDINEQSTHWYENGECVDCGFKLPANVKATRIFGSTRYETSLKVANELKQQLDIDKFDTVILADGRNYPDALAGSYLSCLMDAPILLVDSKSNHIKDVQTYIKANLKSGGKIYMLGGEAAVPQKAVDGLKGYKIDRLSGKDRYETNLAILKEAAKVRQDYQMIVCTGKDFADSLSAAALGLPILLVDKKGLKPSQKEYLKSIGDRFFFIIGGTGAVTEATEKELGKTYGGTNRIGGKTRYETSTKVAEYFFYKPATGVAAYGQNFPDGLCGGALAYAINAPLILTANGKTTEAETYTKKTDIRFASVLGGTTLINDKSVRSIFHMKSSDPIEVKK